MGETAWVAPCARKASYPLIKNTSLCNLKCKRQATYKQAYLRKTTAIRSALHRQPEKALPAADEWTRGEVNAQALINSVKFNDAGLVPAIAQQWDTGEVLMMAWMNADSIVETMRGGRAVYYSRSRRQLWRKGDTSGQIQAVRDVVLDCDGDTILLKVDQLGVACHTGRRSCFYRAFRPPHGEEEIIADVLMDPKELYRNEKQKS